MKKGFLLIIKPLRSQKIFHIALLRQPLTEARTTNYCLPYRFPVMKKIMEVEDVHVIGNITAAGVGKTLVTRDGAEFELKAQGWNPLAEKE